MDKMDTDIVNIYDFLNSPPRSPSLKLDGDELD